MQPMISVMTCLKLEIILLIVICLCVIGVRVWTAPSPIEPNYFPEGWEEKVAGLSEGKEDEEEE